MAMYRAIILLLLILVPDVSTSNLDNEFSYSSSIAGAEVQSVARRLKNVPVPSPPPIDCKRKCSKRCENAGREDRCEEYCIICCNKCHCVPSGHYGNKDECPCYRDWQSSKHTSKCP